MRESGWDLRDSGVADRLTRRVNEGDERGTNAVHRGGACVLALIFFFSLSFRSPIRYIVSRGGRPRNVRSNDFAIV